MAQLNQLLGEVKDLLRQQVTTRTHHQKSPSLTRDCELVEWQACDIRGVALLPDLRWPEAAQHPGTRLERLWK